MIHRRARALEESLQGFARRTIGLKGHIGCGPSALDVLIGLRDGHITKDQRQPTRRCIGLDSPMADARLGQAVLDQLA